MPEHSRQNLVQSSLLSFPTGNQAERIGPKFARTLAGKIWSNPLCCHFVQVAKDMTAKRIGPNFARTLAGKILVQSSLLSFPTGNQGHDSKEDWTKFCQDTCRQNFGPILCAVISYQVAKDMTAQEDWTKFCRDICGQNLVQSSLLSFHTGGQGHDSREDWTKFCQNTRGKIWSNPLCCHSLPVTKQRGLDQILPGHLQAKFWSNPLCCHFLQVAKEAKFGPILCVVISYRWPRT